MTTKGAPIYAITPSRATSPDPLYSNWSHVGAIQWTGIAPQRDTSPRTNLAGEPTSSPDSFQYPYLLAARLQQLCGAVTAKAVEDTLFYRDARLVSLNEVGGTPERFGMSTGEFHQRAAARGRDWPATMVALSTHDTKRSEDVRARITVLSQCADRWAQRVRRWNTVCLPPDEATGLFLWQNIIGVWPVSGDVDEVVRERLHGYAEKAIREAELHTDWEQPDREFEGAVRDWIDALLDGPVANEVTAFVGQLDEAARCDAVAQKLLALTVPGIPDVYQGTELFDDSLVDPDNRRPVDFALRQTELTALRRAEPGTPSHPKIRVVAAALRSRRERPTTYLSGDYTPVVADGPAADHVIAFQRGTDVLVVVPRWTLTLDESACADTVIALPDGDWTDRLTGRTWSGTVTADALLAWERAPAARVAHPAEDHLVPLMVAVGAAVVVALHVVERPSAARSGLFDAFVGEMPPGAEWPPAPPPARCQPPPPPPAARCRPRSRWLW